MAIPVTSSEILAYTPESLKTAMGDEAPVFRLRPANERHIRRFRQEVSDEGLTSYSDTEFNEEKFRAIDALWTEEDAQRVKDRLTSLLEAVKQAVELTAEDAAWLDELDDTLFDNWKPLRVMRRKTGEWREYVPKIMVSTYVFGWDRLDAKHALEAGYLSKESVAAIEKALARLGAAHLGEDSKNLPYLELYVAASRQVGLEEDEEKNSPAPSQPGSNPDASTVTPRTDGASSEASAADKPATSNSKPAKTPAAE